MDYFNPSYEIAIQNIPRIFTAIAEWLSCLIYILILRKRHPVLPTVILSAAFLLLMILLQVIAGIMPISMWIPGMIVATLAMSGFLLSTLDMPAASAGYVTARAFVLAEFIASFEWQLYFFTISRTRLAGTAVMLSFMIVIYLICAAAALLIERQVFRGETELDISSRELGISIITALSIFLFSNLSFLSIDTPFSTEGEGNIFYIRTLIDLAGLILLYSQQAQRKWVKAQAEAAAMQNLLDKQYDQYRMSKENVELINRKYHDLKHKIQVIRLTESDEERQNYLSAMEDEIKRYEVELKTGNNVLDIILTSKNLAFKENGITFICIADGSLLSFMDTMDICSLFGNALDNAMESVLKIPEPEKRVIRLNLSSQNGFTVLKIENSYEHMLNMSDDGIHTTKADDGYHGFGLKSIRLAVEKYGGTLSISTEGGLFRLNMLFPGRK